jgi:hypothetical protein
MQTKNKNGIFDFKELFTDPHGLAFTKPYHTDNPYICHSRLWLFIVTTLIASPSC